MKIIAHSDTTNCLYCLLPACAVSARVQGALQAGRYLCFPADNVGLAVSMKHTIQYKQAHNSLGDMGVDLLFPGTPHTVV
jgi:hypothetical protein